MLLRETAIHWMDGTPANDRQRFRHLAGVVTSCFDAHFEGLETEYVGKVNTSLWSRPSRPDYQVIPERNNRDDTVASIERAYDPAGLLLAGDKEVLGELLRLHVEALLHLAELRGWDTGCFVRAADHVRRNGWEVRQPLPDKADPYRRGLVARAWGVINADGGRVCLALQDRSGRELRRVDASVPANWHMMRAGLHKLTWRDPQTVELQPRQRAGIDLGPRLRLNDINMGTEHPNAPPS